MYLLSIPDRPCIGKTTDLTGNPDYLLPQNNLMRVSMRKMSLNFSGVQYAISMTDCFDDVNVCQRFSIQHQ